MSPPAVVAYEKFMVDAVTDRIALYKTQKDRPDEEKRLDMFHFLCDAKNPDTGLPAYSEAELRSEAALLVVAGSDTTSVSLSGTLFYLTGNPEKYQKLVDEILATFPTVDDIVYGPMLHGCTYLKACIDEGMRLAPAGPSELPREILAGGQVIAGEYYPEGVVVGTSSWVDSRNVDVYGDAEVFRPERWIVDEATGVTKESVAKLKSHFHPFTTGLGACLGKSLAISEMMLVVARTLYRFHVRRAPGSIFGAGGPELGWGASDSTQMHLQDAYITLRKGPEVQFKKRKIAA
jgi:cytochrome P450